MTDDIQKEIAEKEKELEAKERELEQKEFNLNAIKKVEDLLRHLRNVEDACERLGKKMMERGELQFGIILIANSRIHDYSKFHGIEWNHLTRESAKDHPEMFQAVLVQHQSVNDHHPEYWGGIDQMPRIKVAEMVCDWYARSVEMGTDLRAYFTETACKRYDMSKHGKKYKEVKQFMDLLLDAKFKAPAK